MSFRRIEPGAPRPSKPHSSGEPSQLLAPLVDQAWQAFDRASVLPSRVAPAAPILFFGDLDAYLDSPLRVLTVGLNPSLHEFPSDEAFSRFPLIQDNGEREPGRYLDAMSAYFRTKPYGGWFSSYEAVLNGARSSYYAGKRSTALHTDICTPVATDPTWSRLGPDGRAELQAAGVPLWHELLKVLRPQIVLISVARWHLDHIRFQALGPWQALRVFDRTGQGDLRKRPYAVRARWYEVASERSLFALGRAAQKPFGHLANIQKREAGAIVAEAYENGR